MNTGILVAAVSVAALVGCSSQVAEGSSVARLDASAEGGASDAGSGGDALVSACTMDLAEFPCPSTAASALALCATTYSMDYAGGTCGDLRIFLFGHDGGTSCAYDAAGALLGGVSCGVPTPPFSSSCPCTVAGPFGLAQAAHAGPYPSKVPEGCRLERPYPCPVDAGM